MKSIYNERRPPVERKIAKLTFHGLRKTRYVRKKEISSSGLIYWCCGKSQENFQRTARKKGKLGYSTSYFGSYIDK